MAIAMPTKQKSIIEQLGAALDIAKGLYGISADRKALDLAAKAAESKQKIEAEQESLDSPGLLAFRERAARAGSPISDAVNLRQAREAGLFEAVKAAEAAKNKKGRGGKEGKELSGTLVMKVNEGNAIPALLNDVKLTIEQNKDIFGPIEGTLRSFNPYDTRMKAVDSQMRAVSQAFGRYMEGGVLRKEDEEKYRKMFPKGGDTPDVADSKLQIVRRLLARKQKSDIDALRAQGFDVTGLDQLQGVPDLPEVLKGGGSSGGGGLINESVANQQLNLNQPDAGYWLKWARDPKNKDTPEAKEILKIYGNAGPSGGGQSGGF